MPRKLIALALIGALLSSQEAAAARLNERALDSAPASARNAAVTHSNFAEQAEFKQAAASELASPPLRDFVPSEIEFAGEDRSEAAQRPALNTLETAVARQPETRDGALDASAQGSHWNGVFHGAPTP